MEYNNIYKINIFERYTDLKKSNKKEFDNNNLWKIFEYYSCIKLTEEYKTQFYEYDDIDPCFKETNKISRNDTGIDCCNLIDIIVQCKLRKNSLTWKECSTFFGSQVIFSKELSKTIVRWSNLIIARNNDCTLSKHLLERKDLFIDKPFNKQELITFCEDLIINPPSYPIYNSNFKLRDYQIEAIDLITQNKKNVIISLPTGTGKNSVIIYSFKDNMKYLILVPRIILMDQLKKEIVKHKIKMKNKIQLIGDGNNVFDENKLITICVFNSIHLIKNYSSFEKIFIDEAHHINKPAIYYENLDDIDETEDDIEEEDIEEDDINETEDDINETEDDIEDEEGEFVNVKTYTKIIKSLVEYNNNVYLSATIDKTDNFEYYNKDIREMINQEYLCDYTIHVPIFNDDPTNKNICEHLLKNYRNIIIYCSSQKEGKNINKLMNSLQLNSSEYIDCKTSKKKRNIIIEKYKNGEIPFLVNVRILVEGFDAPITKGVCFLHLTANKTTLIQIIGRSLRLHPTKTIANIILPFSSNEDEKSICKFIRVMADNDSHIRKSFESKRLGGYISIETDYEENENIEFKYSKIYSSMGILQNYFEIWSTRLEEVKKYIDENSKRPSTLDKNTQNKQLGIWLHYQQQNYKNKKNNMRNEITYNLWTTFINDPKYKEYLQSNEDEWNKTLIQVIKFIETNNKRPSSKDKDKKINRLGCWITRQQKQYNKKEFIMKNKDIYDKWLDFINDPKYKQYFQSNEDIWIEKLNQVIQYIDINNKRPLQKGKEKHLGWWISDQQKNYKNKECIMLNKEIYNKWTTIINNSKYRQYFISNDDAWLESLNAVKQYIDINNKRPQKRDKDNQTKQLGEWLSTQQKSYKKKDQIKLNEPIYKKYFEFINDSKYKQYFESNEDNWNKMFDQVILYIDKNNRIPSRYEKNIEVKQLGNWLNSQRNNYNKKEHSMKNKEIYDKWTIFINNSKYIKYF
jgi:DNA repair protein RadD